MLRTLAEEVRRAVGDARQRAIVAEAAEPAVAVPPDTGVGCAGEKEEQEQPQHHMYE